MILEIPIWCQNIDDYLKLIENDNSITMVCLNCLDDNNYPYMGGSKTFLDDCLSLCLNKNIPVILLHLYSEKYNSVKKNIDLPKELFKKIEWSTFYIYRTFLYMRFVLDYNKSLNLDLFNNNVNLDTTFEYDYITFNNLVKYHRCMMMDLLAKHDLIKHGAIAWRNVNREYDNVEDSLKNHIYKYKYWKPEVMLLDQFDAYNLKSQEYLVKEYNQSFMQIVTESEDKFFILSEKTAVPLFFNKPFLVVACKNFHNILTDLGFKLYDEIFDYSFDNCDKLHDRVEGIIQNIVKIKNLNYDQKRIAFDSLKNKLQFNRNVALKMVFKETPKEILELIPNLDSFSNFKDVLNLEKNVY